MKKLIWFIVLVFVVAIAILFVAVGPANATDSNEGWHTWATTNTSEPTSGTVHWPQSYVGKGQLAPECGVWYQQDLYKETDSKKDASIADVIEDGVLTNGEDHHIVQEWRFVYGGDCPPEKPEPSEPACGPEGSCGEVPDLTGEAFTVVAGCEGDEWVTRTTTTPWEEFDGERTYGESLTTETRAYDENCVDEEPAPEPEAPGTDAAPAKPVVAEATYTG